VRQTWYLNPNPIAELLAEGADLTQLPSCYVHDKGVSLTEGQWEMTMWNIKYGAPHIEISVTNGEGLETWGVVDEAGTKDVEVDVDAAPAVNPMA